MSALTLQRISKRLGAVSVLDEVSLEVERGEFVALLGASGSGKSTLLRIIAGLDMPDSGTVQIAGKPATDRPPSERDVAMVFQHYALYPHKTVAENIALPLEMRRLSAWGRLPGVASISRGTRAARQRIADDVRAAAGIVGIESLLDRRPGQLSGGQQQRVALARAMVRQPQLLLMDEPLSNLDAKLRTRMRAEISELHAKIGATIVYVTHDQAEAMTMANRIAVMVDGRIVQIGPPQELYNEPCDVRVAEILGSPAMNLVHGAAAREFDRRVTGNVRVGFRPEAARLEWLEPATRDAPQATVVRTEHLGADVLVHLSLADGQRVIVRQDAAWSTAVAGDRLHVSVSADKVLLFDERGARLKSRAVGGDAAA